MTEARPVVRIPTPAAVLAVLGALGTVIALAAIEPTIVVLIVIFGFVFGDDLRRYVTVSAGETASVGDDAPAATGDDAPAATGDAEDALERLRVRYADGDLTDREFERRLEVLLETETVADVERYLDGAGRRGGDHDPAADDSGGGAARELDRAPE